VDLELTGDGASHAAISEFAFGLTPQDEEDLRCIYHRLAPIQVLSFMGSREMEANP